MRAPANRLAASGPATSFMAGFIMQTLSRSAPEKAKGPTVVPFPTKEELFPAFQSLINTIRALWPRKTTAHVAHFTGTSERAVRFWLAGETRMSLEHVIALLRTSEGYAILEAVMGDCRQEWWLTTRNAHELTRTRRQIADAQKRLDAIKAGQAQIDLFQK